MLKWRHSTAESVTSELSVLRRFEPQRGLNQIIVTWWSGPGGIQVLSERPTSFLQCFDTVGFGHMTCKYRPRYLQVFGGTLNLAQSINHSLGWLSVHLSVGKFEDCLSSFYIYTRPTLFVEPNKSAKTLQAKWKKNTIKLWRNAAAVYINLKIKEIKVYTFSIHAELHCILYDKRENLSLQPTESFVLI